MDYRIPDRSVDRSADRAVVDMIVSQKLRGSMLYMVWGLLTTIGIAYLTLTNRSWLMLAHDYSTFIIIAQFALVILFSARQWSASPMALRGMFFVYSILMGLTMSAVALVYSFQVIVYALIGALAVFASFSIVGLLIKRDLSSMGTYLLGGILALVIASVIMYFMGASDLAYLIKAYIGVIVFSLFTAYDVNRIKHTIIAVASESEDVLDRVEIAGALSFYLDFVNIFFNLLRIFRGR